MNTLHGTGEAGAGDWGPVGVLLVLFFWGGGCEGRQFDSQQLVMCRSAEQREVGGVCASLLCPLLVQVHVCTHTARHCALLTSAAAAVPATVFHPRRAVHRQHHEAACCHL
jgi:hypothetical protein